MTGVAIGPDRNPPGVPASVFRCVAVQYGEVVRPNNGQEVAGRRGQRPVACQARPREGLSP